MQNVTLRDGTVIRPLTQLEEFAEAVRIQEETWGAGFTERVPVAILKVAPKIGGVTAGAFTPDGRLLGFVFGMTGVKDGRLAHWSDLLAVRVEAQGRRLGESLKQFQRDCCREIGVETMYWSFDPFVAKNAHLNLNVLGAAVDEFVHNMYGAATNSPVHGSLGTDRFIAAWPVATEAVPMPDDPARLEGAPVVAGPPAVAPVADAPLPDIPAVIAQIPGDYQALLKSDFETVRAWRASARRAFLHYFARGYRVTTFVPPRAGERSDAAYLLTRAP